MPQPPTVFDLNGVGQPEVAKAFEGSNEELFGGPGAVPAHATVRVTNLDQPMAAAAVDASASGSFSLAIVVMDGEELRFEWQQGTQRSAPADALFVKPDPAQPAFTLEPSPRFDCLTLEPGYVVEFAATGSANLALENGCSEALTLDNARLRIGLPDFALQTALPLTIAAGERSDLAVDFTGDPALFSEDTLLVDVTLGADTIRYPITLSTQ